MRRRKKKRREKTRSCIPNPNPSYIPEINSHFFIFSAQSFPSQFDLTGIRLQPLIYGNKSNFEATQQAFLQQVQSFAIRSCYPTFRPNQASFSIVEGRSENSNGSKRVRKGSYQQVRDKGYAKPAFSHQIEVPSFCLSLVLASYPISLSYLLSFGIKVIGKNTLANLKGWREIGFSPSGSMAYDDGLPLSRTQIFQVRQYIFETIFGIHFSQSCKMITVLHFDMKSGNHKSRRVQLSWMMALSGCYHNAQYKQSRNAASLLLYSAPILTFSRVIKKKSSEEFSCVPYIVALLSCLLYTWYGLPVVSCKWENFPLVTINGLGIALEFSFILIYICFSTTRGKVKVAAEVLPVIVVFCTTALISTFLLHDHHNQKVFVGSVGLVASMAMYGSPLVAVKQVIESKSVEFMPFYLSFFSFMASSLWMAYGLLSHDLFLASPNLVGSPLGILQLLLYCKYKKRRVMEEVNKWDSEKNETFENNEAKSKQLQLVVHDDTRGK